MDTADSDGYQLDRKRVRFSDSKHVTATLDLTEDVNLHFFPAFNIHILKTSTNQAINHAEQFSKNGHCRVIFSDRNIIKSEINYEKKEKPKYYNLGNQITYI